MRARTSLFTWICSVLVVAAAPACGSDGGSGGAADDAGGRGTGDGATGSDGGGGGGDGGGSGNEGGASGDAGDGATQVTGPLMGVWQLSGTDARGAYTGQVELRDGGGGKVDVIRVAQYAGVTVEDARELWTAWTGSATVSGTTATLDVKLQRADWVKSRGGVARTLADQTPLAVSGAVTAQGSGAKVHWTADAVTFDDTLTGHTANGPAPIFATAVTRTPAYAAPSASTLASMNSLYASFQALPDVAPYKNDPAFQAGVAYLDVDTTDFDFYRAHPTALRVVNKVVDAPSLGETLARANAYRKTLADKAAFFDQETPAVFLEAATGQLVDDVAGGTQNASGDGALWSAAYLASQAYRYFVTHDDIALANVAKVAGGIQLLMEITPDQTTFARTVRAATASPAPGWHTGTGAFTAYEWLEGGNNDMFKGLFYGMLLAYATLCDPVVSGQDALCARMRTNAAHIIKDLTVAQGGSTSGNNLLAAWLDYYVNGGSLTTAISDWTAQATILENAGFQTKQMATADWSGTHLTFVEFAGLTMLNARKPLPTVNAATSLRKGIEKMQSDFTTFRMGLWSVLFATKVTTPAQADIDNARGRMREIPAPRMALDIDHRVGPGFVMFPYPSVPWKNDWTTHDRTDSLYGYPLFTLPLDVYVWRSGPLDYSGNHENVQSPSADYLHAYWLGRYLGLFTATD